MDSFISRLQFIQNRNTTGQLIFLSLELSGYQFDFQNMSVPVYLGVIGKSRRNMPNMANYIPLQTHAKNNQY